MPQLHSVSYAYAVISVGWRRQILRITPTGGTSNTDAGWLQKIAIIHKYVADDY